MSRPKPLVRRHPHNVGRRLCDRHSWATFMSWLWTTLDGPDCDIGKWTAAHRNSLARDRAQQAMTRYRRRTRP